MKQDKGWWLAPAKYFATWNKPQRKFYIIYINIGYIGKIR
jgi:hypothetical protein